MNLVIFAMEGISQTLFWEYREAMPRLWDIYTRSASFRRFYTNSTSALSSFHDFAYGDSSILDRYAVYPDAPPSPSRADNLFSVLTRHGYETLGLMRASPVPDYAREGMYGAWPAECGPFCCHEDSEACCAEAEAFLERSVSTGKPFALYFSERAARLDDAHPDKMAEKTFHGRIEKGYAVFDSAVDRVFCKLMDLGQLADTMVICYGPYGTDPWKHGVTTGRVHALEPYADLSWTPLFIFRNDTDVVITDKMLCTVDLKPTILNMLFPHEPVPAPTNSFSGVSAFSGFSRQVVFCQNLFALERENSGPALGLIKSYAAIASDRRLMVSSTGGITGEGGLELYLDFHDPGNGRNFLDFSDLNPDGGIVAFGRRSIIHPHFILSFKPKLAMEMVRCYDWLRQQLSGYILEKERAALAQSGGKHRENLFPVDAFRQIRRRR